MGKSLTSNRKPARPSNLVQRDRKEEEQGRRAQRCPPASCSWRAPGPHNVGRHGGRASTEPGRCRAQHGDRKAPQHIRPPVPWARGRQPKSRLGQSRPEAPFHLRGRLRDRSAEKELKPRAAPVTWRREATFEHTVRAHTNNTQYECQACAQAPPFGNSAQGASRRGSSQPELVVRKLGPTARAPTGAALHCVAEARDGKIDPESPCAPCVAKRFTAPSPLNACRQASC